MGTVISTNIGEKVSINHNGKVIQTGIYKYPVNTSIYLGKTDVVNDYVVDRRYHGGVDKACYLYPSENYKFWKEQYPDLKMEWGMFGENLTTQGLFENTVRIGSTYQIGDVVIQVTQPRQPCYKLGIRFNDAKVVKMFSNSPYSGIYVRVLNEGYIKAGDSINLIEENDKSLSLVEVFALLMKRNSDTEMFQKALDDKYIAESAKRDLLKILNNK